jgi:HrpA-like RNA helicase
VVIIESFTGSGKTLLVPQFILDNDGPTTRIACTQPRKIAAQDSAKSVGKMRNEIVGQSTVGYKVQK